ncbi:uncharacterized protein LOC142931614 [Anarhichas minor]|uniref:uncharacterized protein LOC142931614 n=1 Tax=Anarhichas minor TaxID=65739 RepID=UPI003F731943
MNLWLSSHFLVAGLFLSSSALTPEECQPLITPLSLADPAMMYGRLNLIMGYTDNEIYNDILRMTQSMWLNITPSPSSSNTVIFSQENKINGSCVSAKVNTTIDGNTGSMIYLNSTSAFQILPGFDGFLVFSCQNTLRNVDRMLSLLKLNRKTTVKELNLRALYLMGNGTALKDSDMEHFKRQASCLGFSKEPDFIYDPKNSFCAEGEGRQIFGN